MGGKDQSPKPNKECYPKDERFVYTVLNTRPREIFLQIRGDPTIWWPTKMRAPPNKRDSSRYYEFREDHGHDIEEEPVLQQGKSRKFLLEHGVPK